MFFFKNKKIHIDCFTNHGCVASDTPIQKVSNFIPDWWRNIPKSTNELDNGVTVPVRSMKGCIGFIDLFKCGIVIPLWSDCNIKVFQNKLSYVFALNTGLVTHPSAQYNNQFSSFLHMKLSSPWLFREKTGVNFFWSGFHWVTLEKYPKFTILNGVVNFKKQNTTSVNIFASTENAPYQYDMKAGMPLVHLIPISEKEVEPHIHVVDDLEFEKLRKDRSSYNRFSNSYLQNSRVR